MGETCTYDDFLVTVEKDNQELVRELHEELTKLGCRAEIRQAKSGFVVSYLKNKKTILKALIGNIQCYKIGSTT